MAKNPLIRAEERTDALISQIENGEPIDHRKEELLDAWDQVSAQQYYSRQAIERTLKADEEAAATMQELDKEAADYVRGFTG